MDTRLHLVHTGINKQLAFHPSPTPLPLRIAPTRLSEVGGSGRGPPSLAPGQKDPEPLRPSSARAHTCPFSPCSPPSLRSGRPVGSARRYPAARRAPMSPPSGRARVAAGAGRLAGGGGAARRRQSRGSAPRPPPRPAGPPPPRRARLRLSSRLCNVSSRGGGGGGRGPAVAASAARPGGRARREPAAASLPSGRCGRLGAPRGGARTRSQPGCGRSQRTADTRLRGAARRDRPGDGPPRRVPSTLPLPGRLEPEPERAPSYDGGDPAAGERACCPLGCATAAGARGGPRRAPLSGRRSPPPRAPRAPALGLRGQEPRGAPRRRRA